MSKPFEFRESFNKFENNEKIQEQIIEIIKNNDSEFTYSWIYDKKTQVQGIDLILNKGFNQTHIDIKGISYAKNHPYMKNVPIELVSNYLAYINSNCQEGRSWLFKTDSSTHYLIYYWLDIKGDVRETLIQIPYIPLRKWAEEVFPVNQLLSFLKRPYIKKKISSQLFGSLFLRKFNGFKIYSARNWDNITKNQYFTINTPVELDYLLKEFHINFSETISKISKKVSEDGMLKGRSNNSKNEMKDFL